MVPFWGRCTTHFSLFEWELGCSRGFQDFDPWPHEYVLKQGIPTNDSACLKTQGYVPKQGTPTNEWFSLSFPFENHSPQPSLLIGPRALGERHWLRPVGHLLLPASRGAGACADSNSTRKTWLWFHEANPMVCNPGQNPKQAQGLRTMLTSNHGLCKGHCQDLSRMCAWSFALRTLTMVVQIPTRLSMTIRTRIGAR